MLALTATATPHIVDHICRLLHIPSPAPNTDNASPTGEHEKAIARAAEEDAAAQRPPGDAENASAGVIRSSLTRHNLRFVVTRAPRSLDTVAQVICRVLGDEQGSGGGGGGGDVRPHQRQSSTAGVIVYCSTQYACIKVARELKTRGVAAEPFHAGLASYVRRSTQERFVKGDASCRVVVGTVAFGLGVNKADVRAVIHLESPPSVEDW